ncbi:hypothetical protein [Lentilactobacillus diolivorans]|uniref:Uncharacterized protein n=2 Tax=Lentilactobacillus diolivorans TaxID=179838 RepID=A0A0R1SJ06_9LACO|nr:hypothetical protein [Lentilactobacillus diolivorans]KRL69223.1 hypothetical protein FC85_GL001582 [Lentilactobacillus diolivorans DSM 14421]GEP23928.1 hypothetical protein LDI01_15210 [Lentilactobacillus diolivorans]
MKNDLLAIMHGWYIALAVVLWLTFVTIFVSKRYLSSSPVSWAKLYLTPILFIVFGIEKIVRFQHLAATLAIFLVIILLASFLGAHLAYKFQAFFSEDNQIKMIGGKYAISLMIMNVIVMLLINFHGWVNPQSYETWSYTLTYAITSAIVKGLLIGQSVNMWWHLRVLPKR